MLRYIQRIKEEGTNFTAPYMGAKANVPDEKCIPCFQTGEEGNKHHCAKFGDVEECPNFAVKMYTVFG